MQYALDHCFLSSITLASKTDLITFVSCEELSAVAISLTPV